MENENGLPLGPSWKDVRIFGESFFIGVYFNSNILAANLALSAFAETKRISFKHGPFCAAKDRAKKLCEPRIRQIGRRKEEGRKEKRHRARPRAVLFLRILSLL